MFNPSCWFVAGSLLVAGCTGGSHAATTATTRSPSTATSPPATSSLISPADTTVHPAVTATPSRGLVDGQRITVRVTGFGVGGKVWLSECGAAEDISNGCGPQLPQQTLLVTDNHRAGTAVFVVHDRAATKANSTDLQPCDSECGVVATLGGDLGHAFTPITFRPAVFGSNAAPCDAEHLTVHEVQSFGGAGGMSNFALALTNTSSATCSLFGYPTITLLDSSGQPLPFQYGHANGFSVTHALPRPVLIPPRASAYAAFEKYRCDVRAKALATTVRLSPPDSAVRFDLKVEQIYGYCTPDDSPGNHVIVAPIEPTPQALSNRSPP
jgi:hypothetical protein